MFVWEAMRPMCYGHTTLVIPDDIIVDTNRLALFLHYYRATRLLSTPSLLSTMLDTAAETSPASRRNRERFAFATACYAPDGDVEIRGMPDFEADDP